MVQTSGNFPCLQRRGDIYQFRLALPSDLKLYLSQKEVKRSLRTPDRLIAQQRAAKLRLACHTAFSKIRAMQPLNDDNFPAFARHMLELVLQNCELE